MKLMHLALTLMAVTSSAFAANEGVKPFHAEYATFRNGSEVGRTTLDLRDNGDGSWTLINETRGTAGLAKIAGVHVVETSRLRWKDGRPEALDYDYKQDAAFKQRTRNARFDWTSNEALVNEGSSESRYAIQPGLIDRQMVTLAIASDLIRGATSFDYKVAVKDRVEDMRYRRGATETIQVPAGEFKTVLMEREGAPGTDRKRVSRSWFAESLGWLPVLLEQTEKKGDTITLKLIATDRKQTASR